MSSKCSNGLIVLFVFLSACQTKTTSNNRYRPGETQDRPLVAQEYKLKADRDNLEQVRKEVPPEKRAENDELALIMQLTADVSRSPSDIRSKFDQLLKKKRDKFQKDLTREREEFTKNERKSREQFLKDHDTNRKSFLAQKPAREQRDEFLQNQDDKRRDFFATEHERRSDFESDVQERRRSFEDYVRERTSDFNQELRAYSIRFEENKKQKKLETQTQKKDNQANPTEVPNLLNEFNELYSRPGTPLESGQ
jgi:hypothetical protein